MLMVRDPFIRVMSWTFQISGADVGGDHCCLIVLVAGYSEPDQRGARCSSVVRAFAHGAMGHRIDPLWGGPIELFLVLACAPRLV